MSQKPATQSPKQSKTVNLHNTQQKCTWDVLSPK